MPITVVPFTDDYLQEAQALLAQRHRIMRKSEPLLDEVLASAEAWSERFAQTRTRASSPGLVALAGDTYIGHLLWEFEDPAPGTMLEPFIQVGSAEASLTGFAIAPEFPAAARRLYAAAASDWVSAGRGAHVIVSAHADQVTSNALTDLGFGRLLSLAAISTASNSDSPPPNELRLREAQTGDEDAVRRLAGELWRSFSEAPVLFPHIPRSFPDLYANADRYLADPTTPIWLVERNGHSEAMQLFVTPQSTDWFLGPPIDRLNTIYLFWAATDPAARGKGVQRVLLQHTLEWARGLGYTTLALHYLTASLASEFWQRNGLRPVVNWMIRQIDPRSLPAPAS